MNLDRQRKERAFWDKFARKYDPFMKWVASTYASMIQRIDCYVDSSKDVLEIATGTGTIALAIAPNCKKVCACDISEEMINIAKEKLASTKSANVEFIVQDAYDLGYENESFDVVIASNVLHVMIYPEKALLSVHNVLRKGGLLIAPTFCHGNSIGSRITSFFMSLFGFRAYHKWSLHSFKNFLKSNNYEILYFETFRDRIPLAFAVVKKNGENQSDY